MNFSYNKEVTSEWFRFELGVFLSLSRIDPDLPLVISNLFILFRILIVRA
jgi:hypothetical protein